MTRVDEFDLDTSVPWNAKFLELRQYRVINGDCKVSKGKDPKLWRWLDNQRTAYKNVQSNKKEGRAITKEQINMLDSLGMVWGAKLPQPMTWEEGYEDLKKFHAAMRTCNVNIDPKNPNPLAKWVSTQRIEYRRFKKGKVRHFVFVVVSYCKTIKTCGRQYSPFDFCFVCSRQDHLITIEQIGKLNDIGFNWKGPRLAFG